jgi:hypothetical protein
MLGQGLFSIAARLWLTGTIYAVIVSAVYGPDQTPREVDTPVVCVATS